MALSKLGYDQWFEKHKREICGEELNPARISAVDRGRYMVTNEKGGIPAELLGKFLLQV